MNMYCNAIICFVQFSYFLSSIIISYVGEVMGFSLFRATGLAFAIRPNIL